MSLSLSRRRRCDSFNTRVEISFSSMSFSEMDGSLKPTTKLNAADKGTAVRAAVGAAVGGAAVFLDIFLELELFLERFLDLPIIDMGLPIIDIDLPPLSTRWAWAEAMVAKRGMKMKEKNLMAEAERRYL